MHAAAAQAWSEASDDDILEAIASHPRIGAEKIKTKWASGEQAGVAGAAAPTLEALARLNDSYFDKFGYTFLGPFARHAQSTPSSRQNYGRSTTKAKHLVQLVQHYT